MFTMAGLYSTKPSTDHTIVSIPYSIYVCIIYFIMRIWKLITACIAIEVVFSCSTYSKNLLLLQVS